MIFGFRNQGVSMNVWNKHRRAYPAGATEQRRTTISVKDGHRNILRQSAFPRCHCPTPPGVTELRTWEPESFNLAMFRKAFSLRSLGTATKWMLVAPLSRN